MKSNISYENKYNQTEIQGSRNYKVIGEKDYNSMPKGLLK